MRVRYNLTVYVAVDSIYFYSGTAQEFVLFLFFKIIQYCLFLQYVSDMINTLYLPMMTLKVEKDQ